MMIPSREIENPNNIEIWKELKKPDPKFAHHIYILKKIGNPEPERVFS